MPQWTPTREMAQGAAQKAGEAYALSREADEKLRAREPHDADVAQKLDYVLERCRRLTEQVRGLESRIEELETKGASHVGPVAVVRPTPERPERAPTRRGRSAA